jgi:hypothetical protein
VIDKPGKVEHLGIVASAHPDSAASAPGGNQHDMLTGSDSDGRAFTDGVDHTCNNWTSDGMTLPQPANANAAEGYAFVRHTRRDTRGHRHA